MTKIRRPWKRFMCSALVITANLLLSVQVNEFGNRSWTTMFLDDFLDHSVRIISYVCPICMF